MNLINDDDLAHCPNINLNMIKRELPDHQSIAGFSLAWYSSNTVQIQNQRLSSIYGLYTAAKDDLVNVVSVPLDQLLNLHKKYVYIKIINLIGLNLHYLDIYRLLKLLKLIQSKLIK
jgi:hypothetical protein